MLKEEAGRLARVQWGSELEVVPFLAGILAFITWHEHPQGEIPRLGFGGWRATGVWQS